jgi:2-polyprenyl-3-methyl-5-hydroxy-6-metoxy-1,4-benzoquinol methylase
VARNDDPIARVIRAYDTFIVRLYSRIRFHILRQRFVDEIGQYLPDEGQVLDVGCGFGLFSLYYAQVHPRVHFHGMDISSTRIDMARRAAERLRLTNVSYEVADAAAYEGGDTWDCVYMLDLVHHIAQEAVGPLMGRLFDLTRSGGRVIVKDVERFPAYKRWFTWVLDKLMMPGCPVRYWSIAELTELLAGKGFRAYHHAMVDYLPYPHVIYICEKPRADGRGA